ncbi:extracellular solute-binding protein, partial [Rhizobium leguminosarum]|uniref:extracellular solute-binding protein n=1 Tax=Rhizobium leguminosarum TaxID=384 RepID=UPI003F9B96F1
VKDQKIDPAPFVGLIEELTIDGKIYSLPFRSDFLVVYYNKDIFDKAGVPYPTNDMTWAQFDEIGDCLGEVVACLQGIAEKRIGPGGIIYHCQAR